LVARIHGVESFRSIIIFRNHTTEHGTYTAHFDFRRNEVFLTGNWHLDIHAIKPNVQKSGLNTECMLCATDCPECFRKKSTKI